MMFVPRREVWNYGIGLLNGGSVGNGVTEWHPQFDDIRPAGLHG